MVSAESFSTLSPSYPRSSRPDLSQPIAQSVSGLTISMLIALISALPAVAQPSLAPGQEPQLLAQGAAFQEAYTLGPGDRIQIDIFNVPEYSGENGQHQVLVDGTLNLPLVGRVSVEGLTLEQAAGRLRNLYAPYLQRPEFLTISLMERRPVQVGISGEVRRPGSYIIAMNEAGSARPTITTAIERAGGITSTANIRQVELLRRTRGGPSQLIIIDLTTLVRLGDLTQDITIRDGDTIFIPPDPNINNNDARQLAESSISGDPTQPINIAVVGEINRPGSYTVAGDAEAGGLLTLTRALQTAGGVTQSAEVGQIQVRRQPKSGPAQILSVNLWQLLNGDISQDIILQQGDTIYVPTGSGFSPAESSRLAQANFAGDPTQPVNIAVVGEVSRPGSYTVTRMDEAGGLLTVTRALQTAGGVTLSANIREIRVNRRPQAGSPQTIVVNLWEMLDRGDFSQDIILQQGDTIEVPTASNPNSIETSRIATANFAANTATPLNIAIVGEVNRPGTYTISGEDVTATGNLETLTAPSTGGGVVGLPTVTRAIKIAGGITPTADIRRIQVLRQRNNGTQQLIDVNLWELLENGNLNQDVLLQQGDTIVVQTATNVDLAEAPRLATASFSPNRIQVNIVGEIQQPGLVELPPNSSLNQAILVAGGFNNTRAEKDEVELIRLNSNGTVSRQTIPIDFAQGLDEGTNPILQNNDVIVVGRTRLARFGDRVSPVGQVTNSVFSLFGILRFFNLF
ncbi:SLBB domain-containing protein [Oscillatoria acuminata]|uniref:Periplasmic protein involved in polysaccharide export n=1 Tax=Oscillatoria acuminata PCC 6304 TaxID=56110 RepID=K9TEU5_9CYAN|nr:SLBB domain-containing protein [Oscillatoria acuminata]AFY81377.1 periplasmic protein involved in polysaccharide export [Oscillatoria acuminata PCC 6304]